MATLYITEFANMGSAGNGAPQIATLPPIAEQTVAIGAETDASPFNAQTKFVRLHADTACSVLVAKNSPTATTANMRLAAGQTEYFGVNGSDTLSVIANAT